MAKRRRSTKTKAPITFHIDTDSSDPDSPISEMFRDLKHRSCWRHGFASFIAQRERITLSDIKELHKMSPCLMQFPRGERSKRKRKGRTEEMTELRPRKRAKRVVSINKGKLNDGAFTCYFESIWNSFSEDKRTSFTYLDSLLFDSYLNPNFKEKVLGGIKKQRIFSKKYVIIPIVCWNHWNLLIFCHFGESLQSDTQKPCMLLLDSLENADPRRFEPDIRRFVLDIFREEGRPEQKNLIYKIPLLVPKVPQQRDDVECGNFVLYFIKLFMEGAPENFSTKGYPYFMKKDWFTPESLDCFCQKLISSAK